MGFMDKVKKAGEGLISSTKDSAADLMGSAKNSVDDALSAAKGATVKGEETSDTPQFEEEPLFETVSHISAGKNAKVYLFKDRIIWQKGRGISVAKIVGGFATTGGASLLATGIKGSKDDYEMMLLRNVTGVSMTKDGMLYYRIQINTAAGGSDGMIPLRVPREVGKEFREAILKAISDLENQRSAPQVVAAPQESIADQLKKLAELKDLGVLTEEEFQEKRAKLVAQL